MATEGQTEPEVVVQEETDAEVTPQVPNPDELLELEQSSRRTKGVLSRFRPAGSAVPREISDIISLVKARHPKADSKAIVRAYLLAKAVHEGQTRMSGDSFISHPVGVARILAELGMDPTTIIAAFLHDSVEDTQLTLEDLRASFGDEVANIIDGLTKIEQIEGRSAEQKQAGNLRKMIVAMARDMRVIIIKLADRLHNMRTVDALDPSKQADTSNETLEIYAPLAHRLGMQQVRAELEDLAFKTLHPKRAAEVEQLVLSRQPARETYLDEVISTVRSKLREVKVKAEVTGRPKHFYSIYKKMINRGVDFDEMFDLVGVRIIVETVKDCYAALGSIHSLWRPIPGRFKDYIAVPKFNLYQSLHTAVVGPEGKPLEIQIRTEEMHGIAEWGVASHWHYKEGAHGEDVDEHSAWMRRMLDHQQTDDDSEFLESLRLDLFNDEVFVFTPKGDVVELQKGATPIDFAYHIHTEVGHACVGARVDGRLVPLDYQLSSGETVEVMTSKSGGSPSRDWLDQVVTPRARTKIKHWFTKERREEAQIEGRDALAKAMRRAGLPLQRLVSDGSLARVAEKLKLDSLQDLYTEIGEGRYSVQSVVTQFVRERVERTEDEPQPKLPTTHVPDTSGIEVEGTPDVLVKLARCCMPVPGDSIVGYVTRGRGVSIHRTDCPNSKGLSQQADRLVEVSWGKATSGVFPVSIQVEALDRPNLLRDVTTTISDFGMNITTATSSVGNGIAILRFTFELADSSQLRTLLKAVRRVEAVYDSFRVTPNRR